MSPALLAARHLGPLVGRWLAASWRLREIDSEGRLGPVRTRAEQAVYCVWHAELLPQALLHRDENLAVLVSQHRDGELLASVLSRLGYRAVRGSSTRGGSQGLAELIQAAVEGHPLALTPDGPVGPPRRCKTGAVRAAAATGLPIVPGGSAASRAWVIRSWDEFVVPRPGAIVCVSYGEPIHVPAEVPREGLGEWTERVGKAIDRESARCAEAVTRERPR